MTMEQRYRVELTPDELELVEVGLEMLLKAEDDVATIESIKRLLPRLRASSPEGIGGAEGSVPAA